MAVKTKKAVKKTQVKKPVAKKAPAKKPACKCGPKCTCKTQKVSVAAVAPEIKVEKKSFWTKVAEFFGF